MTTLEKIRNEIEEERVHADWDFGQEIYYNNAIDDVLQIIDKYAEQEPCADAVSRQAVDEMIKAEMPERGMWEIEGDKEKETVCEVCVDLMQKLSELPSVRPREQRESEENGVLKQLAEEQNNLLATNKAWRDAIEKNGYVN